MTVLDLEPYAIVIGMSFTVLIVPAARWMSSVAAGTRDVCRRQDIADSRHEDIVDRLSDLQADIRDVNVQGQKQNQKLVEIAIAVARLEGRQNGRA